MLLSQSKETSLSVPVSKRIFDVLLTFLLLVFVSPLMLIIALVIRLESPGPTVFRQKRIGYKNRPFIMYKFRSMYLGVGDEAHRQAVRQWMIGLRETNASSYKIQNDPRVTKAGRFLRKSSLDELPQLFNVLLGEMSLVGPRPLLPYEYDACTDLNAHRSKVLPGMTGLWQVSGWHYVSFDEMVQDDLRYSHEWSLWLDIKILLKTIPVVVLRKGS